MAGSLREARSARFRAHPGFWRLAGSFRSGARIFRSLQRSRGASAGGSATSDRVCIDCSGGAMRGVCPGRAQRLHAR